MIPVVLTSLPQTIVVPEHSRKVVLRLNQAMILAMRIHLLHQRRLCIVYSAAQITRWLAIFQCSQRSRLVGKKKTLVLLQA